MNMFEFHMYDNQYFDNFYCHRTKHQLDNVESVEDCVIDRLHNTLKCMINNHVNLHRIVDRAIIHVGMKDPKEQWDFYFRHCGGDAVRVGECIWGNGVEIILDYFRQKIQSAGAANITSNTEITIYTFSPPPGVTTY